MFFVCLYRDQLEVVKWFNL